MNSCSSQNIWFDIWYSLPLNKHDLKFNKIVSRVLCFTFVSSLWAENPPLCFSSWPLTYSLPAGSKWINYVYTEKHTCCSKEKIFLYGRPYSMLMYCKCLFKNQLNLICWKNVPDFKFCNICPSMHIDMFINRYN